MPQRDGLQIMHKGTSSGSSVRSGQPQESWKCLPKPWRVIMAIDLNPSSPEKWGQRSRRWHLLKSYSGEERIFLLLQISETLSLWSSQTLLQSLPLSAQILTTSLQIVLYFRVFSYCLAMIKGLTYRKVLSILPHSSTVCFLVVVGIWQRWGRMVNEGFSDWSPFMEEERLERWVGRDKVGNKKSHKDTTDLVRYEKHQQHLFSLFFSWVPQLC